MSEGEYEPFQLDQPEIDDAIIAKLDYINAERKLVLSRALIEQTAKYLEQVRELVKDVNQFWAYSFLQHVVIKELCSAKLDIQALSYLSNVELKQNTSDPRPFELVFHFAENPFFTNTILSKKYTLPNGEAEKEGDELIKAMQDWQPVDLESHAITIDWKEGQNLLEKYPRNAGSEGDFEGDRGSFFHFFTEKEDTDSVGILLQADILPEVYNYYIGDGENCETTYSELDEDELDEETGDEEEIDLEAEEENAKKRRRT